MRELTLEEMDNVSGGHWVLEVIGKLLIGKVFDYAWDHKEEYFNMLIHYTGQYGGLYTPIYRS